MYNNLPADYMAISSGLGETVPRQIVVIPFLHDDELEGVLEFGAVTELPPTILEFLQQAVENIAIAFHSVKTRMKMAELLEATQRQAAELQQQQEELRQTNEELEEQTRALQVSQEQLQQQQEELRQTNEELEQQARELHVQRQEVEQKNRDLEQAQNLLEHKAQELEQSGKYKSEFLANMSHELRPPLNSILILSNLLADNKDHNLSAKQVEFARTINLSGSELLNLINEVLDLSKIEAGKMELVLGEMNLQGLATYIQQTFTHVAQNRGLFLNVELAANLPAAIETDRQRVEQVLKNFLSNAFKFTETGGITIRFSRAPDNVVLTRRSLQAGELVAISVSDTGVGIPLEKQQLIFEAFQQADGTTSRKYGGTGLGLSISRELAKLLGGEIQLTSVADQGSTFTFYLPERCAIMPEVVAEADAEPVPRPVAPPRPPVSADALTPKPPVAAPSSNHAAPDVERIRDDRQTVTAADRSILIVEDDPNFVKIVFDLARERGFKVLIAGDGSAGLQLAYQYLPRAIILDIGLPGTDGWMVLEKLKANPDTAQLPVYVISAHDETDRARQMGTLGYLTKPVTSAAVREAFECLEAHFSEQCESVLIVEDDAPMRHSLTELLREYVKRIVTATNGQEAYQFLTTQRFGSVILDLGLPDISGFDFLDQIKGNPAIVLNQMIVYTGRELSKEEYSRLARDNACVIIKGPKSPERLVDEIMVSLRQQNTPTTRPVRMMHDRDAVLTGKTILVVDDDTRNVYALANVLDDKGLNVIIAENGKQALEQLEANVGEIKLVLMDIMMPEMDGYEATRAIRRQPRFARLPIIALTAKAMKGDRQQCLEAGANDYLSKPIDTDKLVSLLRVWLY